MIKNNFYIPPVHCSQNIVAKTLSHSIQLPNIDKYINNIIKI